MRKLVSLIVGIIMSGQVAAAPASAASWEKYRQMKKLTYTAQGSDPVQDKVKLAEFALAELGRKDIAGWNYNNAAYAVIQDFRASTSYDSRVETINSTPKGQRKPLVDELRAVCAKNVTSLARADELLTKASQVTSDRGVNEKVESNAAFIKSIRKLIENGK